jgi:outer membrane lipoprotein SlyB
MIQEAGMKIMISAVISVLLMLNFNACATLHGGEDTKGKSAQEIKDLKEQQSRELFIEGASAFAGIVTGGIIGLLTSKSDSAVTSIIIGAVIGGGAGFGLGHIIYENNKKIEPKHDDSTINEYFRDYRNIQLKE